MKTKGRLIIVSGPAGVGKSEITNAVIKAHPEILRSVSCTTRAKRPDEIDGESYNFFTKEQFLNFIENDKFYEWEEVHGNYYGTLKEPIDMNTKNGKDIILVLDVKGYTHIKEQNPDAIGIFICPPSMENLKKRLLNRNTETPTEINIRIRNMRKEFSIAPTYDYIVINEDWNEVPNALDIAVEQVYNIIQVAHLATSRNQELIEECIEQANQEMTNQQNA